MNNEIKKIGSVQQLNSEGFIINDFSLKGLQQDYSCILDDVVELYQQHYSGILHSVYVRGSVLKGMAIKGISDLDTLAISTRKLTEDEQKAKEEIRKIIGHKYPYLNGLELHFEDLQSVMNSLRFQFLLKTQTQCVYGIDIKRELPDFGIGKYSYAHSYTLKKDIKSIENWLKDEEDIEEIKDICSWIMKRIVRIGFEVVMLKEQCFTRDLYYCYEAFAKHHPEKAKEMYHIMELAVYPTEDKEDILKNLKLLEAFLYNLIRELD